MKFLKLLDPRGVTPAGPGLTIAEQALQARERFPRLVRESRLSYWRAGDPIARAGDRFLIGLAPTFSLADLRLADILNDALNSKPRSNLVIDVFDVDDLQQGRLIPQYFPGTDNITATPALGVWEDGQLQRALTGAKATDFLLEYFAIPETAESLVKSVRPPNADLFDD